MNNGYEAARHALLEGSGVLDLTAAFQKTLIGILANGKPEDSIPSTENAIQFLMNSLAPLEMILRAHGEVTKRMRRMNEQLEAEVAERTGELEQRVRELTALNRMFQEHLLQHSAVVESYQGLLQRLRSHLQEVTPAVAGSQKPSQQLDKLIAQLNALVKWAESQPLPDPQSPQAKENR